jgi:acetyl-CoA C-acetyltransferase
MQDVYLASPVRTPIGKLNGALSPFSAVQLGVFAAKESLRRAGIEPSQVELAVFGNARQAGNGPNIARQIAVGAGMPYSVPAYSVNMACASGLQAILCACNEVALGNAEFVLVGGTESMSNVPYLLPKMRRGYRVMLKFWMLIFRMAFFAPFVNSSWGKPRKILLKNII